MTERTIEKRRKYNPADYAQLQAEAKVLDKKELEEFWVETKDKKHTTCGEVIGIIFLVLFATALIFAWGYSVGEIHIIKHVSNSIEQVSADICPYVSVGYTSPKFFNLIDSHYYENKIVCTASNSASRSLNSSLK